ncbi:hypothetical protein JHK84_045576 [Glycine max]|nr:hypothetical protein JHK84_045576 [Glycine max]
MGEWIVGAFINLFGSIAINFGTNLLKLGHNERERHLLGSDGVNGKMNLKPIIYFQSWRIGIVFFFLGNCLNFISFGYAAQSLLAALGSVQFVSNIAFAYFVLNKMVTVKVLVATAFIVLGNVFLVAFGNHQSPVYTPEQLTEKYTNIAFLLYLLALISIVALHHSIYKRGELLFAVSGHDLRPYWSMLLPFSYAVVSGAVGSCSVLFAKSLSNLLRLAMSNGYQLHSWFTYSMLLLFLSTAGFWMTRLNEGLSLFDAILIVPMFQITWTFFSICTGFIYFQEYQCNCLLGSFSGDVYQLVFLQALSHGSLLTAGEQCELLSSNIAAENAENLKLNKIEINEEDIARCQGARYRRELENREPSSQQKTDVKENHPANSAKSANISAEEKRNNEGEEDSMQQWLQVKNLTLDYISGVVRLQDPSNPMRTCPVISANPTKLRLSGIMVAHGSEDYKNHTIWKIKIVFDALRTTMFILGMMCVFIGISLLAPDESKGPETKDSSLDSMVSSAMSTETSRLVVSPEEAQNKDSRSFVKAILIKVTDLLVKAKTSCALSLGFGEDTINTSSVLVMPMMSSRMTGFRGNGLERARILSMRNGWSKIPMDEDAGKLLETSSVVPPSP